VRGTGKLNAEKWRKFKSDTRSLVRRYGFDIVVKNKGIGAYVGYAEENYIVVGIKEKMLLPIHQRRMRSEVKSLAYVYGQESIALGLGHSDLIFFNEEV